MSTKTTFKRVALVAVAALGMGVLTSVAPANAAQPVPSLVTIAAPSALRAGVLGSMNITITLPAGTATGDTVTVAARIVSAPADSYTTPKAASPTQAAVNSTAPEDYTGDGVAVGTGGGPDTFYLQNASSGSGSYGTTQRATNDLSAASATLGWTAAETYTINASDSKNSIVQRLSFRPDKSGSYTILVAVSNGTASYSTSAELAAASTANLTANTISSSIVVSTAGTPTTAVVAAVTTGAAAGSTNGALFRVTLTDSTGARASLGTGEVITLSSPSTTETFKSHTGAALTGNVLPASAFSSGVAFFQVLNSVAETAQVVATGSGLLPSTVTGSATATFVTPTGTAGTDTSTIAKVSTDKTLSTTGETAAASGLVYYAASTSSTSNTLRITGTAANVNGYDVTDTSGAITGKAGAKYSSTATMGATATPYASVAFAGTLLEGASFRVDLVSSSTGSATVLVSAIVTGRAAADTTMTITDPVRTVATGSSVTFSAKVTDQFAKSRSARAVTITASGRNAATTTTTTDSSGVVSYTLKDVGTAGTTDTVTFTSGSATASATIYYGTATAGSVAVKGPQNALTGSALTAAYSPIATGDGTEAGAVSVTATVKDAAGVVMAGIPVVFTVAGTTAAVTSTTKTVYTGSAGTATAKVYAWVAGSYVVTATVGTVSSTDTVYFSSQTATAARIITATANGNTATAKVVDRFGNPIKGVYVYATRTGAGSFGGTSATKGQTDAAGTVEFILTGGTADVKLSLGDATAADSQFGESSSTVGNYCAGAGCTQTAYTAATVGTTTTDETGVGATIAPAGVNSATVSLSEESTQAAADAAAEATDAANAATDAANAAAEAADAATAAAQDAADAVAALSTQVSEMIDALKKQITALTNLVIKIQKKVKA